MNSRILVKIVTILFFLFVVHISLYYILPTYKDIFTVLKYDDKSTENILNTWSITNSWNVIKWISSYTWSILDMEIEEKENTESKIIITDEKIVFTWTLDSNNLSEVEKNILDLFKDYKLDELFSHSSLFDLTTEYPDPYLEYYNWESDITLYIFKSKLYNDVLNVFDVISYNLPFKIKKVNNFWDESFFINMDNSLEDGYVRLVFSYKNKVFWLKIKKDSYNDIKETLNKLK